jgi:L-histidine N-alpha-methyltransferase
VRRVTAELRREYPEASVHGIVGDFVHHLDEIPGEGPRLLAFLGGTIGNFLPGPAARFLSGIATRLRPGDSLLLGTDLIKEPARLHAAYNDAAGVTAAFNRNILRVVNRLLDGDFLPERYEHRAFYNEAEHRIEMWLRATRGQRVRLRRLHTLIEVAAGEEILTEISTKFDRPMVEDMLRRSGFTPDAWYTDPEELFALSLARRVGT